MDDVLKYRYPNWWWGRYIYWDGKKWRDEAGQTFPASQVNESQLEEYIEDEHGEGARPGNEE